MHLSSDLMKCRVSTFLRDSLDLKDSEFQCYFIEYNNTYNWKYETF